LQSLILTVAVDPSAQPGVVTSSFQVSGGGAGLASTVDATRISATPPGFGIAAFDGQVSADAAGNPFTQAGGHPYAASTSIDFNTVTNPSVLIGELFPVEPTKDVVVDLPPGFVGNPTAAAQCTAGDLANTSQFEPEPLCPPASQVGTTLVRLNNPLGSIVFGPLPVFNLVPPPGVPARFGFNVAGNVVTLDGKVRSDSDYGLTVDVSNISQGLDVASTTLTFWGVPSDSSHDGERACPGKRNPWRGGGSCQSGAPAQAFLRNPTSCTPDGVGLPTTAHIDSWVNPGVFQSQTFVSHNPPAYPLPSDQWGSPQGPTGCEEVPFDPALTGSPESPARAGAPSGFQFDLALPQSSDPNVVGEGDLKKAVVTLPQGVHLSASSANGLDGCSPEQIGLHSTADATCPDASKVGSLTITTPLLSEKLTGSVYLATPHENPFDSLVAIYLVAKGPGLIVKLPGEVSLDKNTGQITTTFDNNPQLPFSDLHLVFEGGPRAPLVTPPTCATYTTHAELTSWSGKTVPSDSTFTVGAGADGNGCAAHGFSPSFTAGAQNPLGGKDSPFLLSFGRSDSDQQLANLTVYMPTGLTGRIANTELCSDAAANAGTCGEDSRIGSVAVSAGAGSDPFAIRTGRAYITGPYGGGPFGLSIVVPAVAGPFDLGNVVVRAAILVDRHNAQLKVVSNPLPQILQGIPLDVREVQVLVDKPHFTVNPTSCAAKHVFATIGSNAGAVAHVASHFQVANCSRLPLAPKMSMTIGSPHHTGAGASTPLTTTLTQTPGQTNLRSVSVTLPSTMNARLAVINHACTLAEFNAGHCSARAQAGSAVAVTPLLKQPLRGPAYFVRNPARVLPDLVVALHGQVDVDLTGKVSIPGGKRLATRFVTIPDVPITKFTLNIVSGANGPVGAVSNLCTAKAKRATASVGYRGHNGKVLVVAQKVHIAGCPRRR
jgi:hypothetical protein